jgi:hypothetical protein
MTASRWSILSWPGAALLGMLGIVVIGLGLTARGSATVASLVSRQDANVSPACAAALRSPRFTHSLSMRTTLALGIVTLMVFKPDLPASLVVLTLSVALGFGVSLLLTTPRDLRMVSAGGGRAGNA